MLVERKEHYQKNKIKEEKIGWRDTGTTYDLTIDQPLRHSYLHDYAPSWRLSNSGRESKQVAVYLTWIFEGRKLNVFQENRG